MEIHSFKDLVVWQKGIDLVKEVYEVTKQLPKEELFCLTAQLRRAAISIPSNIAEGKKRKTRVDYLHFLRMASGSAGELETQLIIIQQIYGQIDLKKAMGLVEEVEKMLSAMIAKLEKGNL
jgi:four helix bundle protein